jgi:hypothetical protein
LQDFELEANIAELATDGSFVPLCRLHPAKMLHDRRMAGLVKLYRSAQPRSERQVRAVSTYNAYQSVVVWPIA